MSGRDRRALESYLQGLLLHLLKWCYQPLRRQTGHSWADSIREARTRIAAGLLKHPGLHQSVASHLERAWPKARRDASRQTGLPLTTFPVRCPWTVEQLGDPDFFSGILRRPARYLLHVHVCTPTAHRKDGFCAL